MSNNNTPPLSFQEYAFIKGWKYGVVSPTYDQGYLTVGGKEVTKTLNGPLMVTFTSIWAVGSLDAKYTKIKIRVVNEQGHILTLTENSFMETFEGMPSEVMITENAPFISRFDEIQKFYVWAFSPFNEYLVARPKEKIYIDLVPPQYPVEENSVTTYAYAYVILYREYDNNFGEKV